MSFWYYARRTKAWMLDNKIIVLLSLLSFSLFVSTLALAGQRNRLRDEVERLKTLTTTKPEEIVKTTTQSIPTTETAVTDGETTAASTVNDGETTTESKVTDGETTTESIVTDGETTAASTVNDGETTTESTVTDGESTASTIADLETSTTGGNKTKSIDS